MERKKQLLNTRFPRSLIIHINERARLVGLAGFEPTTFCRSDFLNYLDTRAVNSRNGIVMPTDVLNSSNDSPERRLEYLTYGGFLSRADFEKDQTTTLLSEVITRLSAGPLGVEDHTKLSTDTGAPRPTPAQLIDTGQRR